MPKRKNSSIKEYKLKSGAKRYYFKISLGTNSYGKRIVTTRRGFKSYSEAEEAFNQLSTKKADDFVKQKQITVSELFNLFYENYKLNVKGSTASSIKAQYALHIDPYFGNQYIDQITPNALQKWATKLAHEIVIAKKDINTFKSLYDYAIKMRYTDRNPLNFIVIPKYQKPSRPSSQENVYTHEELNIFLNCAKKINLTTYTYFRLLASTGLRKSEALALLWDDINFEDSYITVNKTLAHDENNHVIINSPKTKTSIRKVPISETLKGVLKVYKSTLKTKSNIVFCTRKGKYYTINAPNYWLEKVYKKNPNLPQITVHGFRHTFATLLIEETNIKPKTVQMLLGHANIQITLNLYTHINSSNLTDAQSSLNKLNF